MRGNLAIYCKHKTLFFFYLKNFNLIKSYFILINSKFNNSHSVKKNIFFYHSESVLYYEKYINTILDLKYFKFNKDIFLKNNNNLKKSFYNELPNIKSNNLKIYLSFLKCGNQEISYNFGILYKNCFYYLIPAYRDSFKKISPGKLLLYKILNWCFENNISILDFGQGEEGYKKKFTNKFNFIGNYNYVNTYKGYFFFIFIILKKIKFIMHLIFK